MRLEMLRDAETARRKGLTIRTIIAIIWFAASIIAAYYIMNYLFDNEIFRVNFFYSRLFVPLSVDKNVIKGVIVFLIVIAMQSLIVVGYGFGSKTGRQRPGDPTAYSRKPDPQETMYYR